MEEEGWMVGDGFMEIKSCPRSELCMTAARHNLTPPGLLEPRKHAQCSPGPGMVVLKFSGKNFRLPRQMGRY